MDSLTKASYEVMIKEDEGISAKMRQLLNAGLIKEKKDLPFFKSAMKKVKGGTITTVQERQVLLNVLGQFLTMVDEAPEFFNLMRRELAKGKMKKEEVELDEKHEKYTYDKAVSLAKKDGHDFEKLPEYDRGHDRHKEAYRAKAKKVVASEDYFNKNIKKDEGHLADNKQPGEKMKKIGEEKKIEEHCGECDYGFTSFKEFRKKNESWEEDRAMAAQKAQMPASLGGTHKDRSRPVSSTQVTKKKSQYARPNESTKTNEALLDPSKSKAARLFRQGQKQNDWRRQAKASELRDKANKARAKRLYDKKSPEEKEADAKWARDRHHHALHGGQPGHAY